MKTNSNQISQIDELIALSITAETYKFKKVKKNATSKMVRTHITNWLEKRNEFDLSNTDFIVGNIKKRFHS